MPLRGPADRQRRAVQFGQLIVEPTLGAALEIVRYPLAVLDFETVQPAMRCGMGAHRGSACRRSLVATWSMPNTRCRTMPGWPKGPRIPRPELARHLIEACKGCDVVVAYSASFEKRALRGLAAALPELADDLLEIEALVIDALPLIRDHVYHPDFHGSFSLKAVLPALVPSLSYANLEVASGMVASIALKATHAGAYAAGRDRGAVQPGGSADVLRVGYVGCGVSTGSTGGTVVAVPGCDRIEAR